jgi:Na+/H+ antiporter
MEHYIVIIILLAIAIGLSSVAEKIKIPYPVLLMVTGIAVGFIPGFHFIPIDPEVVFLLFLPPILYEAAFNIPFKEFKSNFRTISMMSITLVFTTMAAIAVVARFCIPDMTWPVAFVIGAILSPPDAVAASGITKGLKLTSRTTTILEGESLINDASALIAYKMAVGVAVGIAFSFFDAVSTFFISVIGGCLIGFILAHASILVQKKLRLVGTALISFNILLPFVAYLVAEHFAVSGVLAVVVIGLIQASKVHKREDVLEKTKIEFRSIWSTITYILSGLIFILIGIEFPHTLSTIPSHSVIPLVLSAFAIFLIALVFRVLAIFRHKFSLDKTIYRVNNHNNLRPTNPRTQKRIEQMKKLEPLNWKDALIIGWSGMRGIVSLATALALPLVMTNGEDFPHRGSIVFLATTVVIIMLLIQGLGLPILIKYLKVDAANNDID